MGSSHEAGRRFESVALRWRSRVVRRLTHDPRPVFGPGLSLLTRVSVARARNDLRTAAAHSTGESQGDIN